MNDIIVYEYKNDAWGHKHFKCTFNINDKTVKVFGNNMPNAIENFPYHIANMENHEICTLIPLINAINNVELLSAGYAFDAGNTSIILYKNGNAITLKCYNIEIKW